MLNTGYIERLIASLSNIPPNRFIFLPDYCSGKDINSKSNRLTYWNTEIWNFMFQPSYDISAKTIELQTDTWEFIFSGVPEEGNPFNTPNAVCDRLELILNHYLTKNKLPSKKELKRLQSAHNVLIFKMDAEPFESFAETKEQYTEGLKEEVGENLKNLTDELEKLKNL